MKAIYLLLVIIILYNAYTNSLTREGLGLGTSMVSSGMGGSALNPWSNNLKLPNLLALPWNFACEWNKARGTLDCPERPPNWDKQSLAVDGNMPTGGAAGDNYSSAFHDLAIKADGGYNGFLDTE